MLTLIGPAWVCVCIHQPNSGYPADLSWAASLQSLQNHSSTVICGELRGVVACRGGSCNKGVFHQCVLATHTVLAEQLGAAVGRRVQQHDV